MHRTPFWEPASSSFPSSPLTPTRTPCPLASGGLSLFPFLCFRALAIIEKSKSTDISVVFISGAGAASGELMAPARLCRFQWGLRGSELSWSCQGHLGGDSMKTDG